MHPQKLIDTVVQFEKDLAIFYQRLETVDRFKELKKIMHFMSQHSAIHSDLIRNFRSEASLPGLDMEPLEILHEKIKSNLAEKLAASEHIEDVFEKLAQAETIVSQVYKTIAKHYEKTADVYSLLSQKFTNLADDEMQHYQHIQKEKNVFKQQKKL